MKAVLTFLLVVILGFGFVQLVDWLAEEPPSHVFHVDRKGVVKP